MMTKEQSEYMGALRSLTDRHLEEQRLWREVFAIPHGETWVVKDIIAQGHFEWERDNPLRARQARLMMDRAP